MQDRHEEILKDVARLRGLFPEGAPVVGLAVRHGVKRLRLWNGGLLRLRACYDPEAAEISLNPGIDRERVAQELRDRHSVTVRPSETLWWVFLHELGHHIRRDKLAALPSRNVRFTRDPRVAHEEREAERIARELFLEWRQSR